MNNIIFKVSEMSDVLTDLGIHEKHYLKDGKPVKYFNYNTHTIILGDSQITITGNIKSSANIFRLSNLHISKFIRHATQLISEMYPDLNFRVTHNDRYKSFTLAINIPCKKRIYVSTSELLEVIRMIKTIRNYYRVNTFYF